MDELFKEIEDDIRQERFDRLWQRFGKVMVGISVGIVVITIVTVVVQNRREAQSMEQTGRLITGVNRLDTGDYKGAIAALSPLTGDSRSPYYGLAMLRLAQAQSAAGDSAAAARSYQALAQHGGTFGALAEMQTSADGAVNPDRHSPFYYTLSEWKGWQLLRDGKKEAAAAQFLALRDDIEAPYSLRRRMDGVVQRLEPEKSAASVSR